MPQEIKFSEIPAGVCVESVRGGDTVKVQTVEFVSEEDGDTLVERLEGFGSNILGKLQVDPPIQPNQVQHLLTLIRRDGTATVYLNELKTIGLMQLKKKCAAGDWVYHDDVADVHRLEFEDVVIPNDVGIIYIFSVGWRRAIYYDLKPVVSKNARDREYDVGAALAQFYAYLMFQRRFKISDHAWRNLLDAQWFPFISLSDSTIRNLINHASNSWPIDDLDDAIAGEVEAAIPTMLIRWKGTPPFAQHLAFLEQAADDYLAKRYLNTTTILYPRLEGILRSHQQLTDPSGQKTQKGLSESAVKAAESERHQSTPLLPRRFREYLESVYFASFNPNDPQIKVSRNSVGHGVVSGEECSSIKAATISVLLVDQLSYMTSTSVLYG